MPELQSPAWHTAVAAGPQRGIDFAQGLNPFVVLPEKE
jgi:hypothetical protein